MDTHELIFFLLLEIDMQVVLLYYAWYVKLLLPSSFLLILTSKQSMIYVYVCILIIY